LILALKNHSRVLKDYLTRLKVSHDDAEDYSDVPNSSSAAIIENRTGRIKAPDVAAKHRIRIILAGDHPKGPGAFQYLVNDRLGKSLFNSILETRVLKDRNRDCLDVCR
jgi:hypothetical protein